MIRFIIIIIFFFVDNLNWIKLCNYIHYMFRFINTYTQFNLSTAKYIIRNKKYLIEAPPARPTNSWGLFVKEQTKGISGKSVTEKSVELSKKWA